ncbi:cell division protein ZapE [Planctomonas psychrotolerans]|uniref:cell division protein ZapE n=1 Tax=Planctomonas psychrotolerans TaxID=2528712 RepID=UPI00123A60C8|nr:cell division protein ZapE [Planctomonas psychrotolerans]
MRNEHIGSAPRLADRAPTISGPEIAALLVPPRQFATASFDSYRPDPDYDSQQRALDTLRDFASAWGPARSGGLFSWGRKAPKSKPGVYLDGGFGVGKTHLLAALWHGAPGPKYLGTFIEYTSLVGALGYRAAVDLLAGASLIAIDEFELDDPGDTMMMTRLIGDLVASGSRVAATSNTPPNALGEGRFAAADFLREIHAMSEQFDTLRIDGLDYRRREFEGHARALPPGELAEAVAAAERSGRAITEDTFDGLIAHLGTVHPARYIKLIDGVDTVALTDVHELGSQTDALRFVAFVDRLYDAQVPVLASGLPLDQVFAADMLAGGYRKKYLRATSRLISLTSG